MAGEERRSESMGMGAVVDRNIRALLERRRQEEKERKVSEKIADRVTAFTGSMAFVYLHPDYTRIMDRD